MKVRILTDGRFQNTQLRAEKRKAGDEMDVLEWYGLSLIKDGLAEAVKGGDEPQPVSQGDEGQTDEATETPDTSTGGEVIDPASALAVAKAIATLLPVKGIGEETAEKLVKAGVWSVRELIDADPAVLAGTLSVPAKTVTKWQEEAKRLVE